MFMNNDFKLIYIYIFIINKCNLNDVFVQNHKISSLKRYRTKKCLENYAKDHF